VKQPLDDGNTSAVVTPSRAAIAGEIRRSRSKPRTHFKPPPKTTGCRSWRSPWKAIFRRQK